MTTPTLNHCANRVMIYTNTEQKLARLRGQSLALMVIRLGRGSTAAPFFKNISERRENLFLMVTPKKHSRARGILA